jgi:hypothetical protein
VPQRYNSVSGKGLSGFTTDTAGDQAPDFRWGYGAINQNLQFPNWINGSNMMELTGGTPLITEPTDAGGISIDGNQGFPN